MPPRIVELTNSRVVCRSGGRELIRLDTQSVDLEPGLVERAAQELLARGSSTGDRFRWGYLLGVEDSERAAGPAVTALRAAVAEQVVAPVGHCRGAKFEFSFFKVARGRPPAAEGVHHPGLHLDTHPEIAGDDGPELLRVLVNLAPTPRRIRYLPIDRFELEVPRGDYQVVSRPPAVGDETIGIPGFNGSEISYLTFWASVVPHAGVDTAAGYFVGSFECRSAWRP